jgi:Protein of unknown function (DUF2806)
MFARLCTFVWRLNEYCIPIILNMEDEVFKQAGINFAMLTHLDTMELITINPAIGFRLETLPKVITLVYHEAEISIVLPNDNNNDLPVGVVMVTRAGQELARICGSVRSEEYFIYMLKSWMDIGYAPTSPLPS